MLLKEIAAELLEKEFGNPTRDLVKVKAWDIAQGMGVVLQLDQPNRENAAYIWLPSPETGIIPEIALEYAAESGRHSNTYPSPGLGRGLPALKTIVRSASELESLLSYLRAAAAHEPLPDVSRDEEFAFVTNTKANPAVMPQTQEPSRRREAIPRAVQREVWQRDSGRCVECNSNEFLCFDHIVPFSRGGSNTVRNIQLLCERCNLSKGNRL